MTVRLGFNDDAKAGGWYLSVTGRRELDDVEEKFTRAGLTEPLDGGPFGGM